VPGKAPEEAVQKEFISFLNSMYEVAKNDHNQTLLFLDPMHQVHNNENDYSWQEKGGANTKIVKANSGRRRINIIGAINPVTLAPTVLMTEENCTEYVIKVLLCQIRKQYKESNTICIILDNAAYQRAYSVQNLAKRLHIDLVFLPPYSPNLNLIERLWRYFKKAIIKNKYYKDFKEFEEATSNFFINFNERKKDLENLLRFKFGIIKTN
jgi:transposase